MHSMQKMRVAVGGILTETNTFATAKTGYADFTRKRAPGMVAGAAMLKQFRNVHAPVGGFIKEAEIAGLELIPLIWTFAQPGGKVRHAVYTRLRNRFLAGLKKALPVDGVLLDLHGAMVTDRCEDTEGDFLGHIRKMVGEQVPVITTLDFHANITPLMARKANALIGYDTYPHADCLERGVEAARLMAATIRKKIRPVIAFRQIPLLMSLTRQCTLIPPMADILKIVHRMEQQPGVLAITLAGGFPCADIRDAGASVVVMTDGNSALAGSLAGKLVAEIWKRRREVCATMTPLTGAIAHALRTGKGPIVLADVSDNPGGGAPCDGTVMLKALVEANVSSAVVAIIVDPEAVAVAAKVGAGKRITLKVGGKTDRMHGAPLTLTGIVRWAGKKSYVNKGPIMKGLRVDMGLAVLFVVNNVEIILTTKRFQPYDAEAIRCMGIEPRKRLLVGLKSSVHYRASYQNMAAKIFEVDTPGISTPDLKRYHFRKVRRPIYPLDEMK